MGRRLDTLACALVALLVGCGSDPLAPTPDTISGTYTATAFVGGGIDVLAAGGSLELTFTAGGQLSGSLDIPAQAGGPLQADMAGTYTISGNSISIDQPADTFVRDAGWTWTDGVLEGIWSGSGGSVSVRLVRSRT